MRMSSTHYRLLGATVLGSVAALAVAVLGLRGGPVEAQGVMSAPACQCSAPTAISSMSASVVHCLCGGMSCVLSEHSGPGRSANLMQCVK